MYFATDQSIQNYMVYFVGKNGAVFYNYMIIKCGFYTSFEIYFKLYKVYWIRWLSCLCKVVFPPYTVR